MKVSTRMEYGVLAVADIALYAGNGVSVSVMEISERQGISKKYLEQILPLLRQAGLIRAQKGLRGGYSLARSAVDITLADILNALDNSFLEEMNSSGNSGSDGLRSAVEECLWGRINRSLIRFAQEKSLSDFLQECQGQMSEAWDMYVI